MNRRKRQHGNIARFLIVFAAGVSPRIASARPGMSGQFERFNVALPDGLPLKHLFNGRRLNVRGFATVQIANRRF